MRFKKWKISDAKDFSWVEQKYSVCSLAAKVAAARKNTLSDKELFQKNDSIYSPFELKDMDRAVDRINEAIDSGEKITVYGDYDADGVTATVILYSYLEAMGADVSYYIPSRESEGYGLNFDAIGALAGEGTGLIVTVDNGIAAVEEIELAKSLGIDVVVTDHHMPQQTLPDCIIVDPHREDCPSKFKDICGAFVAFKLVAALDGGDYDGAFDQYAELVATATLADVVPLVDENRTIVRLGLEKMRETDNLGLLALLSASLSQDGTIDSTSVTYGIIPRINAAGRMGDAKRAAELLLCDDEERAEQLCEEICTENNKRKSIEADILDEIKEMADREPDLLGGRVVVVCGEGWHHGVLGIVASKLVEMTGKPALVLSSDGESATGSGRSVDGFSLFDAMSFCSSLFTRFGGHSLACGVTLDLDKVSALRKRINEYAKAHFAYMPQNIIDADAVISSTEISLHSVKELSNFEPFGKDNPSPAFALLNLTLIRLASIGNGKHTRLSLYDGKQSFTALYFGVTANELRFFEGRYIDIIARLKTSVYAGEESVTVQVVDLRPSGIDDELFFKEKQLFEIAQRGEQLSEKQARYLMPSRDEAVGVYKFVKHLAGAGADADVIWWLMGGKINRAKLAAILEAFCQNDFIKIQNGQLFVNNSQQKKDLFDCPILKHVSGYLQS
ncbi:MAG: single-stranded-DNA-specific exonuclease RecJ [Oscillospiraceae bacterium]|nr:single-stranded-DNA-specific exonuclease RecJ [Oscillospiraceae bacterium]